MNQQYPYPDGPGSDPRSPHAESPPPTSYDFDPVPQPGYDPTSSMPVMGGSPPQQQPGYGPPPPAAGGMPPPMTAEPKKSNTPLILGLVIGLVALVGIAGIGVWFLFLKSPGAGPGGTTNADGRQDPFPHSYSITEKAPESGQTWAMSKPETYDKCVDLNLTGVEKVLPFEGNPEGETTPDDENTGMVSCTVSMRGEENGEGYSPTGSFYVDFIASKDADAAKDRYAETWDIAKGYGDAKKLDIGEESEFRTKVDNNVRDVAVAYRIGNVSGLARISINFSTHFAEPDQEMLTNVLIDVIYSGLNG